MVSRLVACLVALSSVGAAASTGPGRAASVDDPPRWSPADTWVTIASVMAWADPGLEDFDRFRRKDLELDRVLGERGVPASQRRLLMDDQATVEDVVAALGDQLQRAPAGSLLVFYFQGHGIFDAEHRFVMTTTETTTRAPAETGLTLEDLLPIFARRDARDRVLLLGDACYSGHLADLAAALSWLGIPTLALTSADPRSESSQNWTFTQALIDALRGRAIVDRDGDGQIRLTELAEEARLAMRHREGQPIGFSRPHQAFGDLILGPALGLDHPISGPKLHLIEPRGEVFARGDWILTRRLAGERSVARVLGARREEGRPVELRVEYYDFSERIFWWVPEDRVDPIFFEEWPIGSTLQVLDDEQLLRAIVLRSEDGLHLVHYVGYDDTEDEWVTPDQIIGPWDPALERERVLVVDGSTLTEAVVKRRLGDRVCVRYRGSSWLDDRCVSPDQVRPDPRTADNGAPNALSPNPPTPAPLRPPAISPR